MRKARIRILIFVGLALVASCVFIAAEFPNQLADFNREPEDAWGVALYGIILAVAAFSYLGAAATILRSSLHWLARPVAIISCVLLIFGTIVLFVLAVVLPSDPLTWLVALFLVVLPLLPLHTGISAAREPITSVGSNAA